MRIPGLLNFFASLALLVIIGIAAGCAADLASECDHDSECADAHYCIDNQCLAECSRDEECGNDTNCEVYQRQSDVDPIQACLDADTAQNGGVECETDLACRQFLDDDDARCGLHGRCVLTPTNTNGNKNQNGANNNQNADAGMQNQSENQNQPNDDELHHLVVIEQLADSRVEDNASNENQSEGDGEEGDEEPNQRQGNDGADNDNDDEISPTPAVKFAAVVVRDESQDMIGFGQILAVHPPDAQAVDDELMSAPISFAQQGSCVDEPHEVPHTSLGGPGGRAYIELLDRYDGRLSLAHEWRLQILASGPECPVGYKIDDPLLPLDEYFGEYRVSICERDATQESLPDTEYCEFNFEGPFADFTDLEVTFPP